MFYAITLKDYTHLAYFLIALVIAVMSSERVQATLKIPAILMISSKSSSNWFDISPVEPTKENASFMLAFFAFKYIGGEGFDSRTCYE